jgi:hypothetical protein
MDGWMDGWVDGWMDGWMILVAQCWRDSASLYVCVKTTE